MEELPIKEKGNVKYWRYLTHKDFQSMDRSKAVVTVVCSPMEVHGPHLPVTADNTEADAITKRTIELLHEKHPEILVLMLPSLYVATDVVPQPGSLYFRSSTITAVLTDLGQTLARQGFRHIWITSFHGSPRHFLAIEKACHITNKNYGTCMISLFSLLVKRLTGGSADLSEVLKLDGITKEDLAGDTHGGLIETSMMLHLLGEYVDPCWKDLPHSTVDIKMEKEGREPIGDDLDKLPVTQIFAKFKEALKYFDTETYSGKPGISSAEIGKQIIDTLAGYGAEETSKLWTGELKPEDCHSPLWKRQRMFLSPWFGKVFEKIIGYKPRIF